MHVVLMVCCQFNYSTHCLAVLTAGHWLVTLKAATPNLARVVRAARHLSQLTKTHKGTLQVRVVHYQEGAQGVLDPTGVQKWFAHILVGDGVATNEAAARIVLAELKRRPLEGGFRYVMLVVKCANHQANLAIGSAVGGRSFPSGTGVFGSRVRQL